MTSNAVISPVRVYLDNCCYSRPFDAQEEPRVKMETESILQVLSLARMYPIIIVGSYMLDYEARRSPQRLRRNLASQLISDTVDEYVDISSYNPATIADIMSSGIKLADAHHVSCALAGKCAYFLSTDKRLLRHFHPDIKLINPIDFVKIMEKNGYELH